ncbi:hypothetical protein CDCA_CDCA13G3638 [Cyanidium caldarium]|uniref:Amino acid transporter transmembrane domain-containing protein n=1 Tax=Cyanidium caldarium TaxID=2771 RepID=A0AAV9IZ38_CYACA|nr:hypothetical protein CDCA_CDCA13G3638 [Cyanidium caldarium]
MSERDRLRYVDGMDITEGFAKPHYDSGADSRGSSPSTGVEVVSRGPGGPVAPEGRGVSRWGLLGNFTNMLKGFLGLNFLYISYAFSYAGVIRGAVGLVLVALLTFHGCRLLVQVKDEMPQAQERYRAQAAAASSANTSTDAHPQSTPAPPPQDTTRPILYGDIGEYAMGIAGKAVVNVSLLLSQFGFCTGYLIFLSHTAHDLARSDLPYAVFVLLPLPVLIPIALLRSVRTLTPFSLVANVGIFTGFASVLVYLLFNFEYRPSSPPLRELPVFFGQVTAAFEGIGVVLPVQDSMKDPSYYSMVLAATMVVLSAVLMLIGLLGFMTFGDGTRSIILLNMGQSPAVTVVKIVAMIGILFTYPLQLVPIAQALEHWIAERMVPNWERYERGEASEEAEADDDDDDDSEEEDDAAENGEVAALGRKVSWRAEWEDAEVKKDPADGLPAMKVVAVAGGLENGDVGPSTSEAAAAAAAAAPIVYAAPSDDRDVASSPAVDSSPPVRRRWRLKLRKLFIHNGFDIAARVSLVLGTALAAVIAGRDFGLFQSLVGALGASTLAYTLPALFHARVYWARMSRWRRAADIAVVVVGITSTVVATAVTIAELVSNSHVTSSGDAPAAMPSSNVTERT